MKKVIIFVLCSFLILLLVSGCGKIVGNDIVDEVKESHFLNEI